LPACQSGGSLSLPVAEADGSRLTDLATV
jgi:hypothetical protein